MNGRLLTLAVFSIFAFAGATQAGMLSDFQSGTLEGWNVDTGGAWASTALGLDFDPYDASNIIMTVTPPVDGAWWTQIYLKCPVCGGPGPSNAAMTVPHLNSHTYLEMDVLLPSATYAGPGWNPLFWEVFQIVNSDPTSYGPPTGGWEQAGSPTAPSSPAFDTWMHLKMNLKAAGQVPVNHADDWAQIAYAFRGGWESTVTFAVDNIELTGPAAPEPASAALLGLGCLMMSGLVRRRGR